MTEAQRLETLSVEDKRELLKNLLSLARRQRPRTDPALLRAAIPLVRSPTRAEESRLQLPLRRAHPGALDYNAFVRACQGLTQRHDALRTRFIAPDNKPSQVVEDKLEIPIPIADAAGWSDERLLDFVRSAPTSPSIWNAGRPCASSYSRSPATDYVLLLVFHHIIADLWSADLLVQELKELYHAERTGRKAALPAVTGQFADFVRWQTVIGAWTTRREILDLLAAGAERRIAGAEPADRSAAAAGADLQRHRLLPTHQSEPPPRSFGLWSRSGTSRRSSRLLSVFQLLLHRLDRPGRLAGRHRGRRSRPARVGAARRLLSQPGRPPRRLLAAT